MDGVGEAFDQQALRDSGGRAEYKTGRVEEAHYRRHVGSIADDSDEDAVPRPSPAASGPGQVHYQRVTRACKSG